MQQLEQGAELWWVALCVVHDVGQRPRVRAAGWFSDGREPGVFGDRVAGLVEQHHGRGGPDRFVDDEWSDVVGRVVLGDVTVGEAQLDTSDVGAGAFDLASRPEVVVGMS